MMKIFIYLFSLVSLVFVVMSCENDKNPVVNTVEFKLSKIGSTTTRAVLNDSDGNQEFISLEWDRSDNGVSSVSNYSLIITKHNELPTLENSLVYEGLKLKVTQSSRKCAFTVAEFNDLLNSLTYFNCNQLDVDIRIKATLGLKNQFINYSNPVNVKVTGYSKSIPTLAFSKTVSIGANEAKLASTVFTSFNDFEGYTYLTAGNYKFYQPNSCGDFAGATALGGSGGLNGTISPNGSDITITNTGYYFIKADLVANTYSVKQYRTLGLYGTARVSFGGINAAIMNDPSNINKWSLEVWLFPGKPFKFKTNIFTSTPTISGASPDEGIPGLPTVPGGSAIINVLGKSVTGFLKEVTPLLEAPNPDTTPPTELGLINTPGLFVEFAPRKKFLVSVDLSKPRNYTYTIVAQP